MANLHGSELTWSFLTELFSFLQECRSLESELRSANTQVKELKHANSVFKDRDAERQDEERFRDEVRMRCREEVRMNGSYGKR